MRKAAVALLLALAAGPLSPCAGSQAAAGSRLRDLLPDGGLIASSVVRILDHSDLDAHYYLADESVLDLDGKAEAVFARFRAGDGEALVLAVFYPEEADAERVYGRFCRDFFSDGFDPKSPRFLEELESGDYAGAARVRSVLIVVLEAPDRGSCDGLLRRIEEKALSLFRDSFGPDFP